MVKVRFLRPVLIDGVRYDAKALGDISEEAAKGWFVQGLIKDKKAVLIEPPKAPASKTPVAVVPAQQEKAKKQHPQRKKEQPHEQV